MRSFCRACSCLRFGLAAVPACCTSLNLIASLPCTSFTLSKLSSALPRHNYPQRSRCASNSPYFAVEWRLPSIFQFGPLTFSQVRSFHFGPPAAYQLRAVEFSACIQHHNKRVPFRFCLPEATACRWARSSAKNSAPGERMALQSD